MAPPINQAGERAGPSEPPSTFECPLCQNPWATLPLPSAFTLARPPTSHRAFGSGLPASWWLTVTLVQPLRGRSQGAWCPKAGDWRHTNPNARLTLKPGHQTGPPGATAHSGRENVPGPPSHHRHSNSPPCQNAWAHAPHPQCPHLGQPLRSPHSLWLVSACLLGPNPNPRSAPECPFPRGLAPQCWGLGTHKPQR